MWGVCWGCGRRIKYVSRVNPSGEARGEGVGTMTWLCALKDPAKAEIEEGACVKCRDQTAGGGKAQTLIMLISLL